MQSVLEVGEKLEEVEKKEDDILTNNLREFFIRIHSEDAMVRAQG